MAATDSWVWSADSHMTRPMMGSGNGGHTVAERDRAPNLVVTLQEEVTLRIRSISNVSFVSAGSLPKIVSSRTWL